MSPAAVDFLEQQLRDAHARLIEARVTGRESAAAAEEARDLVEEYVRGTADHLDALRSFMGSLVMETERLDRERERIAGLIEETDADRRRFRAYVVSAMRELGVVRLRGTRSHFFLSKDTELKIRDAAALPAHLVREVPADRVPLKRKIVAALKGGELVAGASLVETFDKLVIR